MAITFVAAGTGAGGTGTVTPGMPSGATTDDLLILVIEGEGEDTNADSPPTGGAWTTVGTVASATDGTTDRTRCSVYWAWYDSGINRVVPDAGNHTMAQIYAFRGVDTTTPLDISSTSGSSGTNATSHSAVSGQTSTTDGAMAVLAYTHGDGTGTVPAGWANTNLASVSSGGYFENDSGSDGTVGLAYGICTTAGAIGTWTWGTTSSEERAWWAPVLRPKSAVETGYSIAQSKVGYKTTSTTTMELTMDSAITAGNLLVAHLTSLGGDAPSDGTLPSGWSTAVEQYNSNNDDWTGIYYKVAGSSESTTIQFQGLASDYHQMEILEVEPPSGYGWDASPLDKTASTSDSSTTSKSSGTTSTTAQADELAFAVLCARADISSLAASNSFTVEESIYNEEGDFPAETAIAVRLLTSTGTYESTFSWSTTAYAIAAIATFTFSQAYQEVTPNLAQSIAAAFGPAISTGAVSVAPVLAQSPAVAFAPTVATGAVSVTPALAQQLATTFAPTLTVGAVVVSPGLTQSLAVAFAPTVTTGAVDMAPDLAQSLVTSFAPTLTTGVVDVAPALVQSLVAVSAPTVSSLGGVQDVTPGLVQSLVVAFAPTVIVEQFITPNLAQQLTVTFGPALTVGAVDMTPALGQQLVVAFDPSFVMGATDITPGLVQQLVVAFGPTVVAPASGAVVDLVQQLVAAFAPTVTAGAVDMTPGLVQSLTVSFAPTVGVGAVSVAPGLVQSLVTVFVPGVSVPQFMTPGVAQRLVAAFGPVVVALWEATFTPPTFNTPLVGGESLWRQYGKPVNTPYVVLITGGIVTPYPGTVTVTVRQIKGNAEVPNAVQSYPGADAGSGEGGRSVFYGGRAYAVTQSEYDLLDAAGYGSELVRTA